MACHAEEPPRGDEVSPIRAGVALVARTAPSHRPRDLREDDIPKTWKDRDGSRQGRSLSQGGKASFPVRGPRISSKERFHFQARGVERVADSCRKTRRLLLKDSPTLAIRLGDSCDGSRRVFGCASLCQAIRDGWKRAARRRVTHCEAPGIKKRAPFARRA